MTRNLKNVTVTLDEETARWARIEAAKKDVSLSRFLGDLLRDRRGWESEYARAKARYLSKKPRALRAPGTPLPRREELHERDGLR